MIEIREHADLVKVRALYLENVTALEWRPIKSPDHGAQMLTLLDVNLKHVDSELVKIADIWVYAVARPYKALFAVYS